MRIFSQSKLVNTFSHKTGMTRILVAALGNPGASYSKNRHNAGSIVLTEILKTAFFTNLELKNKCIIDTIYSFSEMNTSGEKLRVICHKTKYNLMIVIVDDLETELGKIKKVYPTMGHKGQNGIRNIIQHCGNDFCTIRIGVGRPSGSTEVTEFVLSNFTPKEMEDILSTVEPTKETMQSIIEALTKLENN